MPRGRGEHNSRARRVGRASQGAAARDLFLLASGRKAAEKWEVFDGTTGRLLLVWRPRSGRWSARGEGGATQPWNWREAVTVACRLRGDRPTAERAAPVVTTCSGTTALEGANAR